VFFVYVCEREMLCENVCLKEILCVWCLCVCVFDGGLGMEWAYVCLWCWNGKRHEGT